MIKVEFKKGNAYPKLSTALRVAVSVIVNVIKNKGKVKAEVYYPKESLYEVDKTDQADVLKLYGFKSLWFVRPKGVPYYVSSTEQMMGFRRKTKTSRYIEYGFHQRRNGERLKFEPLVKTKAGEWGRLPDLPFVRWALFPVFPWFGGHDSNGDGKGGKAPKNLHFYIRFI